MPSNKQDRYLVQRGETWYFRKRHKGRMVFKSLGTTSVVRARQKRNDLEAELEAQGWGQFMERVALASGAADVQPGSVGEVIEAYRRAAVGRGLGEKTVSGNISSLRVILRAGGYGDPDDQPLTVLNQDVLVSYRRAQGNTRTVGSTIRQARSLFASWALLQAYKSIPLPDLSEFLKASVVRVDKKVYQRPPEPLIQRTIEAGYALAGQDPDLYCVFLLCYDLGLRVGEAVHARWDWISTAPGASCPTIAVIARNGWKPKGRNRWVPIGPETYADLERFAGKRDHLLPGEHKTARHDLAGRRFSEWMRGLGWDIEQYPKTAHELRKLRGSEWFTRINPQTAQAWLGHTSIATTCEYYATLSEQPSPLGRAG